MWNMLPRASFLLLMGTDIPYNQMGLSLIIFSLTEEIRVCGRRHYNPDRSFMLSKSPNYSVYKNHMLADLCFNALIWGPANFHFEGTGWPSVLSSFIFRCAWADKWFHPTVLWPENSPPCCLTSGFGRATGSSENWLILFFSKAQHGFFLPKWSVLDLPAVEL